MRPNCRSKFNGFTLIEILIVVSIMAILAAILFSVIGRVRENGRITVCQSNLKQIALAIQQYTADNDGYYPSFTASAQEQVKIRGGWSGGWHNAVFPYIKNVDVFFCPSHPNGNIGTIDYEFNWVQLNGPVKRNKSTGEHESGSVRKNKATGERESKFLPPSTTALNWDAPWTNLNGKTNIGSPIQTSCGETLVLTTHNHGINVSFLDGHVKWFSNEQFAEKVDCPIKTWIDQNPHHLG